MVKYCGDLFEIPNYNGDLRLIEPYVNKAYKCNMYCLRCQRDPLLNRTSCSKVLLGQKPCWCSKVISFKDLDDEKKCHEFRTGKNIIYELFDNSYKGTCYKHRWKCPDCTRDPNDLIASMSALKQGVRPCFCSDNINQYTGIKDAKACYKFKTGLDFPYDLYDDNFLGVSFNHRWTCKKCTRDPENCISTFQTISSGHSCCFCAKVRQYKNKQDWIDCYKFKNKIDPPNMTGDYIRSTIKTEFFCQKCKKNWMSKPFKIINGAIQTCPSCASYGFNINIKACFYILMLNSKSFGRIYKIGISNNSVKYRYKDENAFESGWKQIYCKWFNRGIDAKSVENKIKIEENNYRIISNYKFFNKTKNTEIFTRYPKSLINSFYEDII